VNFIWEHREARLLNERGPPWSPLRTAAAYITDNVSVTATNRCLTVSQLVSSDRVRQYGSCRRRMSPAIQPHHLTYFGSEEAKTSIFRLSGSLQFENLITWLQIELHLHTQQHQSAQLFH